MKRRSAIKQLLIIAGGIAILPSCSNDSKKASIQLTNLDVTSDQEALLAEIVDTIIPKGSTEGGKDLNLHLFVLKMVDDCHPKEQQEQFMLGLNEINALSDQQFNKSFRLATAEERAQLIRLLESDERYAKKAGEFYNITKKRTIQGFLNSKFVMTDLKKYELIPGRYNGYFPVDKATS